MKKQRTCHKKWAACAAVFIGLGILCQAQAQTSSIKDKVADIEWITPETPPYPPVFQDGKWMTWEQAFGPLPKPKPIAVKRPKNPQPPKPIDPQKQWVEIKRKLAPWMTEEQLRAVPEKTPALEIAQRRATFKNGFVPKVDPAMLLAETKKLKKKPAELTKSGGSNGAIPMGGGGMNGPEENGGRIPTLHLVNVAFTNGVYGDYTIYELWVTDAPEDKWFELYFADELNPNRWVLAHIGQPEGGWGTSSQCYVITAPGHPQQGFFRMFPFQDSDGDGLTDGMEIAVFKSNPNDPDSSFQRDADGDGQPDFPNRGGNWIVDGDEDFDGDGISNIKELAMGTDPLVAQDYVTDSDHDGLPDWAENLIWIYQGILNPELRDDSDGDGVDNYTELALFTDPSLPDAVYGYCNFYTLPDARRSFTLTPITIRHIASTNPASTNNLIYDTAGTLGTYLHLEVRRNEDAYGNPLPDYDTILFGGSFLSPPRGMFMDMLSNGVEHADAYIPWSYLLLTTTSLIADIWEEAKVSDAIDQLNIKTIFVLQQRSMLRTVIRLRELQLTVDVTDASTGTQMRVRTALSEIYTETTLFRETSFKIARYQGQNWWTRAGHWVSVGGRIATIFSVACAGLDVWTAAQPYIYDVSRRCDNNMDTAADLAVALGNFANEFASGFMLGNFWLVYWNQLSIFDGYDCQCW